MPVDKAVVRNNYGVQVVGLAGGLTREDPEELGWCHSMHGPEDSLGERPHLGGRAAAIPEKLRLRTERQTLRRLPKTGAVVFTIRVYTVPVQQLALEAGEAARLAAAIRSWPAEVAADKGGWGTAAAAYLDS
jgi:hypothetical protein